MPSSGVGWPEHSPRSPKAHLQLGCWVLGGGHEATETGLAYAPVSQAHGHNHIAGGGGGLGHTLHIITGRLNDLHTMININNAEHTVHKSGNHWDRGHIGKSTPGAPPPASRC